MPPKKQQYEKSKKPAKNPLNLSVQHFAEAQTPPISRQMINMLCVRGDLFRGPDKKIDVTHPTNAAWLAARKGCPPPSKPPGRWPKQRQAHAVAIEKSAQDEAEFVAAQYPPAPVGGAVAAGGETSFIDPNITDALTRLLSAASIHAMTLADVQKVAKIEAALKTRVEREQKRGDLIERTLVRTVFGRIYQIESQEMRTLGAKLAPDVAGLLGIDDSVLTLMVEQRIDNEILKSLAHIKKVINDFLIGVETEII